MSSFNIVPGDLVSLKEHCTEYLLPAYAHDELGKQVGKISSCDTMTVINVGDIMGDSVKDAIIMHPVIGLCRIQAGELQKRQ